MADSVNKDGGGKEIELTELYCSWNPAWWEGGPYGEDLVND